MPSQASGTPDIATLTYWQPGVEEYDLVYRAAQAFALICDLTSGQREDAALIDLIDALFFRFFMTMQSCTPSLPQPLLDCLLCCCESPTLENAQREHYPALNFLTSRLLVAFAEVVAGRNTVKQVEDAEHTRLFIVCFFHVLRELWNVHKWKRLEQTFWTPMPWSRSSRMAEYKSHAHLDNPPCITIDDITNSARDDLFYFPDILWLGGRHDGYCRATKLSAYVWIRLRTARSATEHLALWQAAVSFGILEALSGLRITESVLVTRRADGALVLTSAKVSQFIWFWLFGRGVVSDPSEIRQWVELARRELSGATLAINEQAMNRISTIPRHGRLTEGEFEEILCSLAALIDVLSSLCSTVVSGSAIEEPSRNIVRMDMPFARYRKIMTMQGWCPSVCQLTELSTTYTHAYATTLSPPLVEGCAVKHVSCTEAGCQAYIVDSDDYETRHALTCSDPSICRFLKPAITSISQLLSSGNIPVIVYDGQSLIVRNAADGPYIAISHVWADGLGSTTEQGLPECQVAHIASLSRELVPNGAFWLDSLCVPGDDRALRRSAIRLMANGYRNADKVLVFDAAIRQLSRSAMPLKEIILRIAMSSWMYRVWTLQEALLARELYFEFADMLVSLASLRAAYKHCREPVPSSLGPVHRDLFMSNHCRIPSLSRLLSDWSPSDAKYSFEDIVRMLNRRSTGKSEDETLAIARLLGIDVAELLAVEDADARMRIFFLNLKTVPASIALQNARHKG
ncbi:hypothetical protein C8Q74DRAFT_1276317 [Fomes fomentarius]|nr:hypothetical protein C8Q74DRAFT_1276317 [Fomes fomentarius]